MSEPSIGDSASPRGSEPNDNRDHPPPRKRQRVRLSCLECRRRKLSCDRELPCSRCIQSGTADRCEFETRASLAPSTKLSQNSLASLDHRLSLPNGAVGDFSAYRKDNLLELDRIRKLELEVSQLKGIIAKQISLDGSTINGTSPSTQKPDATLEAEENLRTFAQLQSHESYIDKDELRFLRGREFKTRYLGLHSARLAFSELNGLCPFMKETAEEWLHPLDIHHKKDRTKRKADRSEKFAQPDLHLEALLPSKEVTDALISVYLDQFEQIHRIVHIPSFRREYAQFWGPEQTRSAAFTALVLSMISISSCMREAPPKFEKMVSNCHCNALKRIKAVDEWQDRQSQKHRRLIHFQIACLLYLAKRVNTVKKKRFWKGAGQLVQEAVSVGLHREPTIIGSTFSPFYQEMRRRIWATIESFDMQASYDHGLPTLLSSLQCDVEPPSNLDDDDFDENSEEIPPSKPNTEYTYSSYQHISRQSLLLRLRLSRALTSSSRDLDYEEVIRYTDEINQEIDCLPSWNNSDEAAAEGQRKPLLAYTLLHIQLRQYIIPLHHRYLRLRKTNSQYQYSEVIYYNAARDMVLLHDKLMSQGILTLDFMREDNQILAMNLCSVTMLQPRGSTNMIMINSHHTLQLVEKCLQMKEDRMLRCGNDEPWGYSIMCASVGLLEAHLGTKKTEAAKAAAAERFINFHYKLLSGQDPPISSQQTEDLRLPSVTPVPAASAIAPPPLPPPPAPSSEFFTRARTRSVTPFPPASQASTTQVASGPFEIPGTPWWLPNASEPAMTPQSLNNEFNLETLGLNVNELWGSDQWEFDNF